eukprot:1162075-Pelagomonas_calceolata.AAC.13
MFVPTICCTCCEAVVGSATPCLPLWLYSAASMLYNHTYVRNWPTLSMASDIMDMEAECQMQWTGRRGTWHHMRWSGKHGV